MWAISVATIGPSRSAAPSFSNRDACRSQTASLRHCSHISTLARRPARRLRLTRHFSGIGRQPGDIRAEWPKVCCAACYGARNSNPLLGVWGPEFMTFVMPSSSTGCSPGIGKASIHSLISLTWQPTSATRTSTRPWCISPYSGTAAASQRAIPCAGSPDPASFGKRRKRMKPTPFPHLLHAFFHDWLVQQRNVSHHTVLSYRDSLRLFLRFVAAEKKKSEVGPLAETTS